MALTDPSQIRTTDFDTETTSYGAGSEPWNKNLSGFNISTIDTDTIEYICDWGKWHGAYRTIAEIRSTIDVWARWVISKKITFKNKEQEKQAMKITGGGKDTFRKILINIKKVSKIGGDAFAEIIRDRAGRLLNLKTLNPGNIKIVSNSKGFLKEYQQVHFNTSDGTFIKTGSWTPKEMLHIINEKIAEENHGIPEIEKIWSIIKMRHQAMGDQSVVLHRYGKPTNFYEADTDDETELEDITATINKAVRQFENVVTPKGVLSKIERISTPQYSTLDPIPWLLFLRSYFTESSNVPDLIRGKSDEVSLAAGKLNWLGFKEKIIQEQLDFAEEIKMQLGLDLEFEEPKEIDIEIAREAFPQEGKTIEQKQEAKANKTATSGRTPK